MDLDLDPTQTLLRDTVRDFLERRVPFDRVRACEREGRWDAALWKDVVAQGWLGLPLPEAQGGAGGSLVEAGLLIEAFAQRAVVVPLAEALACAIACARQAPERSAPLVAGLLDGSRVPVPAVLEAAPARGAPLAGAQPPALSAASAVVSGEKQFVDYAACATHHVLAARDAQGPALFLVDASARGIHCAPLHTIGRTPSSHVRYHEVPVERIAGPEALRALIASSRLFAAVQCLGSAQQALDRTVAYARVRKQFGRPIGSFQAVQHHCANMASRVAATRFLVYEALYALERGDASPRRIAFAKASASRMVPEVTLLAHQIHGGNGVIEENDLYFFTLRGKDRSLAWGSAEECLAEAAAEVDAPQAWLLDTR